MKLYPLVLAFLSAGLGLLFLAFPLRSSQKFQTAGVNAVPLRVTIVSSANQIGPAGKFFDNAPTPSVRSEDGLYRIQVVPPTEARRRPCHSMSSSAIELSNRFRKLFGLEQIKVHTIEHHHNKLVPIENVATMPLPPVPNDGGVHIMPVAVPSENMENMSAQPVHRHSHHHHHRLHGASFMARLSHALMMLGRWEGRAVAFVLGKQPHDPRLYDVTER